eukprot:g71875.t1
MFGSFATAPSVPSSDVDLVACDVPGFYLSAEQVKQLDSAPSFSRPLPALLDGNAGLPEVCYEPLITIMTMRWTFALKLQCQCPAFAGQHDRDQLGTFSAGRRLSQSPRPGSDCGQAGDPASLRHSSSLDWFLRLHQYNTVYYSAET